MPTLKQRKVAKKLIEAASMDNPPTYGEILEKVGYGPGIVKNPQMIMGSAGVQEALQDYGFTEENAKKVVAEILLNKEVEPNARLKATDQVFKVRGSYAPEKKLNLNIEAEASPEVQELTKKLNELHGSMNG